MSGIFGLNILGDRAFDRAAPVGCVQLLGISTRVDLNGFRT